MDTMDMDTDMTTGTEVVICIRIRGIHIRVPGGFSVPVSITTDDHIPPMMMWAVGND